MIPRTRHLLGIALVLLMAGLAPDCGGEDQGAADRPPSPAAGPRGPDQPPPPGPGGLPEGAPNFVLIDIDSLRSDRIHATRDGQPLAPRMAAMADEGAFFPNLISQGAWTMPAIAALLTGMDPGLTQVQPDGRSSVVGGRPQLPKILEMYGYQTAAFWGDTCPAGFAEVVDLFQVRKLAPRRGEWTYQTPVVDWIAKEAREPFFLLVHEMDLYDPQPKVPEEFLHRYTPHRDDCTAPDRNPEQFLHTLIPTLGLPAASEHLIAHYDGAVTYYDGVVGAVVDQLRAKGVLERTVVMVLSDHGNDLLEHGMMGHGSTFDSVIRVPLIVLDPSATSPGEELPQRIQTVDIAPTILARAGIPIAHEMSGASLLPLLGLEDGGYQERPAFSLSSGNEASLRGERYKLMQWRHRRDDRPGEMPAGQPVGDPILQLYDLQEDPAELHDIRADHADVAADLEAQLTAWLEARSGVGKPREKLPVEDQLRKTLKEDGYWELVAPEGKTEEAPNPPRGRP